MLNQSDHRIDVSVYRWNSIQIMHRASVGGVTFSSQDCSLLFRQQVVMPMKSMMSRQTAILSLVAALVGSAVARESSDYAGIFKTSSFMALEWKVEGSDFTGYQTEDIAAIESATAKYFSELLAERSLSAFQSPNKFVDVTVSMLAQVRSGDNLIMDTALNVYHIGDSGLADLSDLLRFVTNKNTTGSDDFPALDSLIGMGVKVGMVSFANSKDSEVLVGGGQSFNFDSPGRGKRYTESERTLIVVTSVLSVALFALSIILIWVAGGWLALRKQVEVLMHREEKISRMSTDRALKQNPTQDTEDEIDSPLNHDEENATQFTNPSGILGVNPYYGKSAASTFKGLGVKMTPARKKRLDDMDSSAGLDSPSSEYSDSGRMPIGIQSMRKLLALRNDNDSLLGDPSGMKRLDYDE